MNRFKFKVFLEEFPFLEKMLRSQSTQFLSYDRAEAERQLWSDESLLEEGGCFYGCTSKLRVPDEIKVKSLDELVLDSGATEDRISGSLVGIDEVLTWHLIYADRIVRDVAYTDNHSVASDDAVLAAIDRYGADGLSYVVSEHTEYASRDHHSVRWYKVIIYKLPKGISLSFLIEKATEKARSEVRAESDF